MVFTIGGIRELRLNPRRPRRHSHASACTAVAEYTGLCGWEVALGARVGRGDSACSCGRADCPAPGAHPLSCARPLPPGSTLEQATAAWDRAPGASVLLPTGLTFDVLEVPVLAGRRALVRLERLGLPLGPVILPPHGRAWFFVAPGGAAELPGLLYRMGWDDPPLDVRGLGAGSYVTAPPSSYGRLGPVVWLRAPSLNDAVGPPQARLLLGALAYFCRFRGVG